LAGRDDISKFVNEPEPIAEVRHAMFRIIDGKKMVSVPDTDQEFEESIQAKTFVLQQAERNKRQETKQKSFGMAT